MQPLVGNLESRSMSRDHADPAGPLANDAWSHGDVYTAAGVVRSVAELAGSEHVAHRGSIVEVDDRSGGTFAIPQSPWRFSDATAAGEG